MIIKILYVFLYCAFGFFIDVILNLLDKKLKKYTDNEISLHIFYIFFWPLFLVIYIPIILGRLAVYLINCITIKKEIEK